MLITNSQSQNETLAPLSQQSPAPTISDTRSLIRDYYSRCARRGDFTVARQALRLMLGHRVKDTSDSGFSLSVFLEDLRDAGMVGIVSRTDYQGRWAEYRLDKAGAL